MATGPVVIVTRSAPSSGSMVARIGPVPSLRSSVIGMAPGIAVPVASVPPIRSTPVVVASA